MIRTILKFIQLPIEQSFKKSSLNKLIAIVSVKHFAFIRATIWPGPGFDSQFFSYLFSNSLYSVLSDREPF